eukprot:TRINITY_DN3393_c0_g1_i2.p1 TRINITY_DN3393_c0_g1~~TRINITY_DN3393_c0_g1_i2.p1  ORF type:complete len:197 (-),score=47.16 TRINITY_DN3393_c0_g1_i2:75-665(-)
MTDTTNQEEGEKEVVVLKKWDAQLVVPNIYLGSSFAAFDKQSLLDHHISQAGVKPHYPHDFEYLVVTAHDVESQDLLSAFPYCFDFIQNAISNGGSVLVHCGAGVSRSAMIMIAYVMIKLSKSYEKAYELVEGARSCIYPNRGFNYQLKLLEQIGNDIEQIRQKKDEFTANMGFFFSKVSVLHYTGETAITLFKTE